MTPAADYLCKIRDQRETKNLDEKRSIVFHHTVAQLLFLSGRARQDIQTALAFLTTKAKDLDKNNWSKLKRVLKYLKGTRNLELILTGNKMGLITWYIDVSFAMCKG